MPLPLTLQPRAIISKNNLETVVRYARILKFAQWTKLFNRAQEKENDGRNILEIKNT